MPTRRYWSAGYNLDSFRIGDILPECAGVNGTPAVTKKGKHASNVAGATLTGEPPLCSIPTYKMDDTPKLSYTSALVLQTVSSGYSYGFDIMEVTGLPSGTVYPTLRRLEQLELIKSSWEAQRTAFAEQRPARKYYTLTHEGKETLAKSIGRYTLFEQLVSSEKSKRR